MNNDLSDLMGTTQSQLARQKDIAHVMRRVDYSSIPLAVVLGIVFGLIIPGSSDLSPDYRPISSVLGWVYFFSWTLSFYPQVILNHMRGTTVGMASDKLVFDVLGFSCLSVYSVAMYCIPSVRNAYRNANDDNNPKVQINDVCFALHAMILTFVQIGQIIVFDGKKQMPTAKCFIGTSVVVVVVMIYLALVVSEVFSSDYFTMLSWLYFISFVKIGVTLVKYVPQVLLNFNRKSTVGWNITGCVMDLVGGTLSQLQLLLDCDNTNDWSGVTGDIVKLLLGAVSVVFDIIFMTQHYCLYPEREDLHDTKGDYAPLLVDNSRDTMNI